MCTLCNGLTCTHTYITSRTYTQQEHADTHLTDPPLEAPAGKSQPRGPARCPAAAALVPKMAPTPGREQETGV